MGHGEQLRLHCERPGGVIDEGADSIVVQALGLKGHEEKLRLGTMWQDQSP